MPSLSPVFRPAAPAGLTAARIRRICTWLTIILFFKIGGFFTLSENVAITRVLKILIRISMTGWVFAMYASLTARHKPVAFRHRQVFGVVFYGAYLLLGFASLMWSSNPGYSLLQWVMNLESLVFAYLFIRTFIFLRTEFPEHTVPLQTMLGRALTGILAIFLIGTVVDPDRFYRMTHGGEVARLGGLLMNPNELGMLAVIALAMQVIAVVEGRRSRWVWISIAVGLAALVLTGSRSSMIGFFLILSIFVQRHAGFKIKAAIFTVLALSIPFVINMIFIKQGDLEEVLSMTGRLPFWQALLTEGLPKSPFWGFGFMRIAEGDTFQSVHTYAGHMTHNTFIQVLMNLGFIGFLIVVLQMAFTFWAYRNAQNPSLKRFFLGLLIPVLINSFTEFGIFGETNFGILFYQLLIFLFVIEAETQPDSAQAKKQTVPVCLSQ